MTEPDDRERAAAKVEVMLAETLDALGPLTYDEAGRQRVLAALRNRLAATRPDGLDRAIEDAKTFYIDARGVAHRITEMASGHIHNAARKLKREPWGGTTALTILAMEDEIARREAAQGERDG